MMKSWSRLCFLVLVVSSAARGQNGTSVLTSPESTDSHVPRPTPSPLSPDETKHEAPRQTTASPSPRSQTSTGETHPPSTAFTTSAVTQDDPVNVTEGVNGSTAAQPTTTTAASAGGKRDGGGGGEAGLRTTVSTTTASASPAPGKTASSSWGTAFLVLIILVIIILCVILYLLRRVSRTYSFDLQRPNPTNHHSEPIGATFESVYLDDLDQPTPKDQVTTDDLSPPPAANGTTLQPEEKLSNGDNVVPAPQEQPNGLETPTTTTNTSNTSNTSPPSAEHPSDQTSSPLGSTDLLLDAVGEEQQNENNNNPSVCSSDPFVEISLDDPAWCDQLLTSPGAPSSVLPFSPFSFASSSSSSSS
ncbi:uncharacterized protein [Pempheris klunzingeri]|uniref:uncharacterized protein n=1 Tax=Pempheris klunzingeri TaxID=3127111 RepID=UPI00397FA671